MNHSEARLWHGITLTALLAGVTICSLFSVPCSLRASQAAGTGTSEACAGFTPKFCARTDLATVPDTPLTLPPVNTPFIDPDFGERMVRVATETTLQTDSMYPTALTNWYGSSASRYPVWGVYCPVSGGVGPTATCMDKGCYRFGMSSLPGLSGTAMPFVFCPATFTTTMGIGMPGSAYVPFPSVGHTFPGSMDSVNFSLADPDLIYSSGAFTTPAWIASSHFSVGVSVQPTTANGHQYIVTTAGTSSSTQPAWCTSAACTLTDGSISWKENGAPVSIADNATIQGWHVTDPVPFLAADLTQCVVTPGDIAAGDGIDGPYPILNDTGFEEYGGHTNDFTGTARRGQNQWDYLIYYNASTNVCDFYNTATSVIGNYNFNTSTRTITGTATDPLTGRAVGPLTPAAPTLTQVTGTGLGNGTHTVQVAYLTTDGTTYYESLASGTSSITLSGCVSTNCAIQVTSPAANQAGMTGSTCNTTSSACYFDQPTAPAYDVYIDGSRQTGNTPIAVGTNWTSSAAIVSGAALPTIAQSGFLMHSGSIDLSGQMIIGTDTIAFFFPPSWTNAQSLNIDWLVGTTQVQPFAVAGDPNYTTWPWPRWGGHSYLGWDIDIGDQGGQGFYLNKRVLTPGNVASFAENQVNINNPPPPACVNLYGEACGYNQDRHPAVPPGTTNQNAPFFNDSYRDAYPDANNMLTAIGGPWQREEFAIDPVTMTAYRFAHRRAYSFNSSVFDSGSGYNFWNVGIQTISQDGKFVLLPTDWDGTLGGTSCSGYQAGVTLCGLHEISSGGDFDGTSCALTVANSALCVPEVDAVIVELK